MGAGYFIIAILGCADGGFACRPLATVPTRYESRAACRAATTTALIGNSDFDYPTIVAECRPGKSLMSDGPSQRPLPASARRIRARAMPDAVEPMLHEDALPGHESALEPKPEWQPRYPGSGRLADKVALVTGADSGIGRAVAALFAREGADVAILYLCEHDDAAVTRDIVTDEGRRALTIAGDLGDADFCRRAVDQVVAEFGGLDILVNNAGEQHPDEDITDISDQQLRRTFQTNIYSMFYLTQAARPHLGHGATIINCTSVVMYKGSAELLDYAATKGAITAFTRSLSQNLVGDGIRVNAVAPGPIWTPLNPMGGKPPEDIKQFGKDTPMKRAGQPNEVAPAFLFLACEDSSYMTGQVLHPNGGVIVNG